MDWPIKSGRSMTFNVPSANLMVADVVLPTCVDVTPLPVKVKVKGKGNKGDPAKTEVAGSTSAGMVSPVSNLTKAAKVAEYCTFSSGLP